MILKIIKGKMKMIKKKKYLIILVLIILSLFIIVAIPGYSMASGDPISDPGLYDPYDSQVDIGENNIVDKANVIIGVIKTIGIIMSVLILVVLGIKYMFGSLEEKAEYKKTMIPYFIGAIMIFAIPQLVQIIYNITTSTLN